MANKHLKIVSVNFLVYMFLNFIKIIACENLSFQARKANQHAKRSGPGSTHQVCLICGTILTLR